MNSTNTMPVPTVFHDVLNNLDKLTLSELSQLHVMLAVRLGNWFSSPPSSTVSRPLYRRAGLTATSHRFGACSKIRKPGKEVAQQVSIFANDATYIAMKDARKETIAAMKASCCKFWELEETTLIGRNLYTRAKFDLLKQTHRKRILHGQGETLESLQGVFINAEHQRMGPEQVVAMRNTALSQCAKLIARCGGVENCRKRKDDCPRYVELSIVTFKLTESEFFTSINECNDDQFSIISRAI